MKADVVRLTALFLALVFVQWGIHAKGAKGPEDSKVGVPGLDEMAGDWMEPSTLMTFPAVANFHGTVKTSANVLGISLLEFPPYSKAYEGNTLDLSIDGQLLGAARVRWYPYQVARESAAGSVTVESTVRMAFEDEGVLARVVLRNGGTSARSVKVGVVTSGFVRRFDGVWNWDIPRPKDEGAFQSAPVDGGKVILTRDTRSAACMACAFTTAPGQLTPSGSRSQAEWTLRMLPGETRTLEIALAVGGDAERTADQARSWSEKFGDAFDGAKVGWQKRWEEAFTPGNGHYSGNAPVLVTGDEKVRRDYYMGVLTFLLSERTNLPLARRAYVSGGPEWALTLEYFWDTSLTSTLFAMLDPEMLKVSLLGFLSLDYHHCYARCMQSGKPAGPWYAANDLSLFTMLWNYVTITGDWSILEEKAGGRTVLEHMDGIATHWKSLVPKGAALADYGGAENLLECAPTYIQQVPSLNAANVWMMRRMAEAHDHLGDHGWAGQCRADAAKLEQEVLKLYLPGEGVWNCRQGSGKQVQLRHCYDYITVGESLRDDLTPVMKREMTGFVEKELVVPGWMRAQSLSDPSASSSDRPDHGPKGSYDGWPALTVATMCGFGQYDKALELLRECEGVTHEGSFAQSHELLPAGADGLRIRVAHRGGQDYPAICGASFASEAVIRGMFGVEPQATGRAVGVRDPENPRGFEGRLKNVRCRGKLFTVTCGMAGVAVGK